VGGSNKEGGNAFNGVAFAPGSSFPKVLRGGVMEEVMGPFAFRSSNGAAKGFDSCFVWLTSGVVYSGKSGCTVLVPPSDTTGIRGFPFRENMGGSKINVMMELAGGKVEGGDVRNGDRWKGAKDFELQVHIEIIDSIARKGRRGCDGDRLSWVPEEA